MNRISVWTTVFILIFLFTSRAESNPDLTDIHEAYYIWTRNDMRMCATPACGGFFVKALNRLKTVCDDGSQAADCYVFQIDFSELDMSENEQASFYQAFTNGLGIVKGNFVPVQQGGIPVASLKIDQAWLAQTGKASPEIGFFWLHDTGIQCITTPCLSIQEGILNTPWDRLISGVDLSSSGAGIELINAGYQEMKTRRIIATGNHQVIRGPAGLSQILIADEFYLPADKIETCGNTVCPPGQTCCNASCGICTPPSVACIQIVCD